VSHATARTTFHGRLLIVQRHQQGRRQAHIAVAMGVSRRCVAHWLARYRIEGPAGLHDRSSRPHRMPARTSPEVEAQVVEVRRRERRGRDWIAAELGVPARTVSRILARHQMPHLDLLGPMTGQLIRASKATAVRYERDRPGELVHMDVKKLGRIPDGGGWRVEGPGTINHRGRSSKTRGGYDYVHSLVDDHSRPAYSEILPDERGTTCAGFLARGIAYFAAHGIDQAKPNASTEPCKTNGRTGSHSPTTTSEPKPVHPGSSTTTIDAVTAHSEDNPRPADCHQPDGRVHLAGYTETLGSRGAPPADAS